MCVCVWKLALQHNIPSLLACPCTASCSNYARTKAFLFMPTCISMEYLEAGSAVLESASQMTM